MKKIVKSLPFKLLVGVIVGMLLGLVANEAVMNVVVTVKPLLPTDYSCSSLSGVFC